MSVQNRIKWTYEMELALLDVWELKLSDLRRKRNSHVYADIANFISTTFQPPSDKTLTGVDVKNKISNLTQRYRSEKKVLGPSGESPSNWKFFSQINKILGSVPCNDISSIDESCNGASQNNNSMDSNLVITTDLKIEDEESNEIEEEIQEDSQIQSDIVMDCNQTLSEIDSFRSSSPAVVTSSSMIPPNTTKRKVLKRKAQEELDRELINEFKRSNDLMEKEMQDNADLREHQMRCLLALERSTNALFKFMENKYDNNKEEK